jgi:hypothetical protein
MGDAPNKKAKHDAAKMVALVIRHNAHADIADLDEGQVSKTVPLVVSQSTAKRLLACHSYLDALEG